MEHEHHSQSSTLPSSLNGKQQQQQRQMASFYDFGAQNLHAPTPPMTPRQTPLGSIRSPLSVMRDQSPAFSPARSAFGSPFTSPLGHEPLFGATHITDFLSSDSSHGLLGIPSSDSGTADELLTPMKQSRIRTPEHAPSSSSLSRDHPRHLDESGSGGLITGPSQGTDHMAEPPASISPPMFAFDSPQPGGLFRSAVDMGPMDDEQQLPDVSFSDMPSGSYLFYSDDQQSIVQSSSPLMRYSEPDAPVSYFKAPHPNGNNMSPFVVHENRPRRHSMLNTHEAVVSPALSAYNSPNNGTMHMHPRRASFNEVAVRSPMFNDVFIFGRHNAGQESAGGASLFMGHDPNESFLSFGNSDTSFSSANSSGVFFSDASSPVTTHSTKSRKRKQEAMEDTPGHFPCTFPNCDKVFDTVHSFRSHIRTHSGDRPFACMTCAMRFSRNHDLKRHERIHQGVRPYVCEFCGKSFLRLDALNRHLKVNNGKGCRTRVKKSELVNLPAIPVRITSGSQDAPCQPDMLCPITEAQ